MKLFSPVNITVQCDALENRLLVVENRGNSAAILDALFVSWADFDVIAPQSSRTSLSSFRGKNNLPTLIINISLYFKKNKNSANY